jgi:uncharacterized protein (TIGR03437 family)
MGTLSFNSAGRPFNFVELSLPYKDRGASVFVVDTITVTPFSTFTNVSAASYTPGAPLAAGSIASGFGSGLTLREETAGAQPLPWSLAETTVSVTDGAGVNRPAPLFYAGPAQINWLVPEGTPNGPLTVKVNRGNQEIASGAVTVETVSPGIFTANCDGKGAPSGWAVTVAPDGTQTSQRPAQCGAAAGSCTPLPIGLGPAGTRVILALYGTGIRGRTAPAAVTATIGGINAPVEYAGAQMEYTGLDQVNVAIPRELAGRGEVDVVVTVDGKPANTVRINIR